MNKTIIIGKLMHKQAKLISVGLYRAPAKALLNRRYAPAKVEYLQLVIAGKAIVLGDDGIAQEYGKGTFFWFMPGELTVHRTIPADPMRLLVIRFEVELKLVRDVPVVTVWQDLLSFDSFVTEVFRTFHTPDCDTNALGDYIQTTLKWKSILYSKRRIIEHYPSQLRNAIIYIHNKYAIELSLNELAKHCKISKPYLFLLFRQHLNLSPHQYLIEYRLGKAREMMTSSLLTIKEISQACGFGTIENFYRQFKQYTGFSPGEYRRRFDPFSF